MLRGSNVKTAASHVGSWSRVVSTHWIGPATWTGRCCSHDDSGTRPLTQCASISRPHNPHRISPASTYRRTTPSWFTRAARTGCTATKSASLTNAGCASDSDSAHSAGITRRRALVATPDLPAGVARVGQNHCHKPQVPRLPAAVTIPSGIRRRWAQHTTLVQLACDPGTLRPASRSAKIHRTCRAVAGSGSSRCRRGPHAACARFGCGPASTSRYPYGDRPPRNRPCSTA